MLRLWCLPPLSAPSAQFLSSLIYDPGPSSEKRPERSKVPNLEPKWPQKKYIYFVF